MPHGLSVEQRLVRTAYPVHERGGWIAKAVVYGLAPRNFDPPTFQGITARLDDLADLGITALWFAPLTQTPPDDYGYAVTDYFDLRPEYGTKADFKALVDAAHARAIRVLMDFVPNHSSDQHPYFLDALEHGDEVGAEFHPYEASGPIDWSDRHGLRADVKKLIKLRQRTPALHSLHWLPLTALPATPLFAYLRTGGSGQAVVVVLNFSDTALETTVELPAEATMLNSADFLIDLWSGETLPQDGQLKVSLLGWDFRFLTNGARNV